jgi:8-oxo-dGTP pyrophosphatase MutT (NUDIX family)
MELQASQRIMVGQSIEERRQRPRKLIAGSETGFGAGVLLYAKDTGRFLWLKRASNGDYADYWCTHGGGVEDHETISEAVHREGVEEIGYEEPYELIHMHRDVQLNLVFHNHMAIVPAEFEPELNNEHIDYCWSEEPPQPLHPGLERALSSWAARQRSSVINPAKIENETP